MNCGDAVCFCTKTKGKAKWIAGRVLLIADRRTLVAIAPHVVPDATIEDTDGIKTAVTWVVTEGLVEAAPGVKPYALSSEICDKLARRLRQQIDIDGDPHFESPVEESDAVESQVDMNALMSAMRQMADGIKEEVTAGNRKTDRLEKRLVALEARQSQNPLLANIGTPRAKEKTQTAPAADSLFPNLLNPKKQTVKLPAESSDSDTRGRQTRRHVGSRRSLSLRGADVPTGNGKDSDRHWEAQQAVQWYRRRVRQRARATKSNRGRKAARVAKDISQTSRQAVQGIREDDKECIGCDRRSSNVAIQGSVTESLPHFRERAQSAPMPHNDVDNVAVDGRRRLAPCARLHSAVPKVSPSGGYGQGTLGDRRALPAPRRVSGLCELRENRARDVSHPPVQEVSVRSPEEDRWVSGSRRIRRERRRGESPESQREDRSCEEKSGKTNSSKIQSRPRLSESMPELPDEVNLDCNIFASPTIHHKRGDKQASRNPAASQRTTSFVHAAGMGMVSFDTYESFTTLNRCVRSSPINRLRIWMRSTRGIGPRVAPCVPSPSVTDAHLDGRALLPAHLPPCLSPQPRGSLVKVVYINVRPVV